MLRDQLPVASRVRVIADHEYNGDPNGLIQLADVLLQPAPASSPHVTFPCPRGLQAGAYEDLWAKLARHTSKQGDSL